MARIEQYWENGKFITVRKHPFGGFLVWVIAIGLIYESCVQTPLLIVPTVILIGLMLWYKAQLAGSKKPKSGP